MPVTHVNEPTESGVTNIDATETTITVRSTERMPHSGPFIIQINDELMYCSAVASDTTITVSARGYLGTDNQALSLIHI